MAKVALSDREFLESHGWRFITSQRTKYGVINYWDHPVLSRNDGLWRTQSDAVSTQRRALKAGIKGYRGKQADGCYSI